MVRMRSGEMNNLKRGGEDEEGGEGGETGGGAGNCAPTRARAVPVSQVGASVGEEERDEVNSPARLFLLVLHSLPAELFSDSLVTTV